MKLSEAIRLGSMTGPQAFGRLFRGDASCAQGAAALALGITPDHIAAETGVPSIYLCSWPDDLRWQFTQVPPPCPECGDVRAAVDGLIRHLNDTHQWTREQIADLVETIEQQQEPWGALQALSLVGVGIE